MKKSDVGVLLGFTYGIWLLFLSDGHLSNGTYWPLGAAAVFGLFFIPFCFSEAMSVGTTNNVGKVIILGLVTTLADVFVGFVLAIEDQRFYEATFSWLVSWCLWQILAVGIGTITFVWKRKVKKKVG